MITLTITIAAAAKIILLLWAGRLNANMDLIDANYFLHRGHYWSLAAKQARKDYNNDGKMSFLEGAFSRDAWHWQKKYFIMLICVANMLSFFWLNQQNSLHTIILFFADAIASWIIFGAGLEFRLQQVRYNWFAFLRRKRFYCYGVSHKQQPSCATQCDYCKHAEKNV